MNALDVRLLLFVQDHLRVAPLDVALVFLDDFKRSVFLLIPALGLLLYRGGPRARRAVLFAALAVALTDAVGARVIKPWFARPRPPVSVAAEHPLMGAGGWSFPSNHAANSFAACVVLGLAYRRWLAALLGLAGTIAFSRVYVGVHYPSDVLAGAVLGTAIGLLFHRLFERRERLAGKA